MPTGYSNTLTEALIIAHFSTDDFRVGAVITDKRGAVLAQGVNKMRKSHPMQAHYARQAQEENKIYLHAEIAALVRNKSSKLHTIYVGRLLKDDTPGLSRPCEVCLFAIRESGIRYIVYVDSEGNEVKEEVKNASG